MDNTTALHEFERYLRRRYPERSTAKHYLSDLRQFRKVCAKPWAEVTPQDVDAFMEYGQEHGWKPATLTRRAAALVVPILAVENSGALDTSGERIHPRGICACREVLRAVIRRCSPAHPAPGAVPPQPAG